MNPIKPNTDTENPAEAESHHEDGGAQTERKNLIKLERLSLLGLKRKAALKRVISVKLLRLDIQTNLAKK